MLQKSRQDNPLCQILQRCPAEQEVSLETRIKLVTCEIIAVEWQRLSQTMAHLKIKKSSSKREKLRQPVRTIFLKSFNSHGQQGQNRNLKAYSTCPVSLISGKVDKLRISQTDASPCLSYCCTHCFCLLTERMPVSRGPLKCSLILNNQF